MGLALKEAFESDYTVSGKNSKDFDANDFEQVRNMIASNNYDIVMNTVAYRGIDICERDSGNALKLNTLFPKMLAELSNEVGFLLVHFSTGAVFDNSNGEFITEKTCPKPIHIYGMTKYGGDCFIQTIATKYYIFRISILFGETNNNTQFVEKMLEKVREGQKTLRVADDNILSPTYSKDAAEEIRTILEYPYPFGIYHLANEGKATLYDLMSEIVKNLSLDVKLEKASYKDFPYIGLPNTSNPIRSEILHPLRSWKEAVNEYAHKSKLQRNFG